MATYFTWANIDPDSWHHLGLLGHNGLSPINQPGCSHKTFHKMRLWAWVIHIIHCLNCVHKDWYDVIILRCIFLLNTIIIKLLWKLCYSALLSACKSLLILNTMKSNCNSRPFDTHFRRRYFSKLNAVSSCFGLRFSFWLTLSCQKHEQAFEECKCTLSQRKVKRLIFFVFSWCEIWQQVENDEFKVQETCTPSVSCILTAWITNQFIYACRRNP